MEAIRNYLEAMFQNLPNTQEVQRAKYELGQMMEDKYTELRDEGKTENEAVGTVISEFGNLEELAEELGIEKVVKEGDNEQRRQVTFEEAKQFLADKTRAGYQIALGVFLCIISPCGFMLEEFDNPVLAIAGMASMFILIAIAVGLFVFSNVSMGKWDFLKKEPCSLDFATAEYVHNQKENYRLTKAMMITVGVVMCIVSIIPVSVIGVLDYEINSLEYAATMLLFVFVAIGCFLFVANGNKSSGHDTLLRLNKMGTVGANFVSSQKTQVRYSNKTLEAVMSVYWPTITCIYLCWSFLTFDWYITWIIWVIAAIVENIIKKTCAE